MSYCLQFTKQQLWPGEPEFNSSDTTLIWRVFSNRTVFDALAHAARTTDEKSKSV